MRKNIEFIALGKHQIEFSSNLGKTYFDVYDPNPDAVGKLSIELNTGLVKKVNNYGYKIPSENKIYFIKLVKNSDKYYGLIIEKVWGWLPISWFRGKLSERGYNLLKSKLESYT